MEQISTLEALPTQRESRVRPGIVVATQPNRIVRWVFYLSIFAIPFHALYIPGTGEKVGVTRAVQLLLIIAMITQPRACLRLIPVALIWFALYCGLRMAWGFWLSPEWIDRWWQGTFILVQFFLPWLWFMFNVLQFPRMGQRAIWALACGVSFCAFLHLSGIGKVEIDQGAEGRSGAFGEAANLTGAIYAVAVIAMVGTAMLKNTNNRSRLAVLPLIGLVAVGLAMTGSRTAALLTAVGMLILTFQQTAFVPRVRRYVTLLLIVAVLAGVAYQVPAVANRFQNITAVDPKTGEARARIYPVLWGIFLKSPWRGTGPDAYQDELTRRAMPHWIGKQKTVTSHNLYLRLLVETGVFGALVFIIGLIVALKAAWQTRTGSFGLLSLAMLLPLITIGSVFNDPLPNPAYWFVIAFALAGRS
jgi:O-antigen ligase